MKIIYICPECQQPMKNLGGLKIHFKARHSDKSLNIYQASSILCGKKHNPSIEELILAAVSYIPNNSRKNNSHKYAGELLKQYCKYNNNKKEEIFVI